MLFFLHEKPIRTGSQEQNDLSCIKYQFCQKSFTYGQCISFQINIVLILLVLFFSFDAAQYLISSILYKNKMEEYYEKIKKGVLMNESELVEPPSINKPGNVCFIIKFSILIFASLYLIFLILKI